MQVLAYNVLLCGICTRILVGQSGAPCGGDRSLSRRAKQVANTDSERTRNNPIPDH